MSDDILSSPEGQELLAEARRLADRGFGTGMPGPSLSLEDLDVIEDVEPAYYVVQKCLGREVMPGDAVQMSHQTRDPESGAVSFGPVEMVTLDDVQPFGVDVKLCYVGDDGELKAFPLEGDSTITVHRPTLVGSSRRSWEGKSFWQRLKYLFTGSL